ncbi:MAG: DnaJ domain-containing protein [Burkholderiales bacterium]
MTNQTLYEILEVRQTATQDSIRASWERLSVKWDPTCTHNTNREARTRYAAITDAYLVLGNPQKRAAYDRKLSAPTQAPVQKTSRTVPATEAVHHVSHREILGMFRSLTVITPLELMADRTIPDTASILGKVTSQ